MDDDARRLPRTDLGPYRLEELLGQGGMGTVYRAVDQRLRRRVAIKRLPSAAAGDEMRRRRFRHEAATLARLSHPAIVQIFDLLEQDDGDWIVMELVEGPTVAELLDGGPLSWSRMLDIGQQVAEGLGEAHDQGILHRDLKAENVMLRRSTRASAGRGSADRVAILDFGIAKMLARDDVDPELSRPGQVLGTLRAMSPEQVRGLPLDARSDLFSLGVLLYEMATGDSPFQGTGELDTQQRIAARPHRPVIECRPEAPVAFAALIDRLLEKSPGDRPASAHQVAEELARIAARTLADASSDSPARTRREELTVEDEPTLTEWTPASGPLEPYRPRRRRLVLSLLLGVVVTMAVASWTWRRQPEVVTTEPPVRPLAVAGLATDPDAHTFFQEGMAWLERSDKPNDLERALASFEAALARDGSSAAAHAGLALVYRRRFLIDGDPLHLEQALSVAQRAVRLDEHLALARVALGTANTLDGRLDEALSELTIALQLDPLNPWGHRGLGELHRRQGRLEEAALAFEEAVRSTPRDPKLRGQLGQVYYLMARYEEAEKEFLASVELAPGRAEGYRDLSGVYYMQARLPEAAEALQNALAIRPEHFLYSNLGTILFAQGLYPPAARAFEKALQHGGANLYLYWGNLADTQRLMAGHEAEARESYDQAIELLRQELEKTPGRSSLRSRLALYQAKSGAHAEALLELSQLALLDGKQANDLYRIAVAYEICGRRAAALETLAAALEEGYSQHQVRNDPELFELRADPAYRLVMTGS